MKVLVIDEAAPARRRLRRLIAELDEDVEIAGEIAHGQDLVRACAGARPDLVALDLGLLGTQGPAVFEALSRLDPAPTLVLLSADAPAQTPPVVGLLRPPVPGEPLREALARAAGASPGTAPRHPAAQGPGAAPNRCQYLSAYDRGSTRTVPIDDVRYLLAEQKYVTVFSCHGRMLIEQSLCSLERAYPGRFLRVHRNALIAAQHLSALERDPAGVTLAVLDDCKERAVISRRRLPEVRRFLRQGRAGDRADP